MKQATNRRTPWAVLMVCVQCWTAAVSAVPAPEFEEIYELLRTHLPGVDEVSLQRAAVEGLLSQFSGRASVVYGTETNFLVNSTSPLLTRMADDRFAYVRLTATSPALASQLELGLKGLATTNQVKGGVLDLRFAQGRDFDSAADIAGLLVNGEKDLLDWGSGMKRSPGKNPAGKIPWVVLINSQTRGAPEAVAAVLRQTESALLVGARSAGQAATTREFPLKSGARLQIISQPVKVGDGQVIPLSGIIPDIEVALDASTERKFWDEAGLLSHDFATSTSKAKASTALLQTNRPPRRRINEADLVRMQREGRRSDSDFTNASPDESTLEASKSGPQDPVFVRALDLLKGLAILRKFGSE